MKDGFSIKHLQVDKANAHMLIIMSIASALTIFSLIAAKSLFGQMRYQNRVIEQREAAVKQLEANVKSAEKLVAAYQVIDSPTAEPFIPPATGQPPDPNSKTILDALPSKYDFPALATSLEKILTLGGYKINSIIGTDEELNAAQDSSDPIPVEMPFEISASGTYDSMQSLVRDFLRSIRPFQITSMELTGSTDELQATIKARTYYQPKKSLTIQETVVP